MGENLELQERDLPPIRGSQVSNRWNCSETDGLGVGGPGAVGRQPELRAFLPPRCCPSGGEPGKRGVSQEDGHLGAMFVPRPATLTHTPEAHSPSTSPAPGWAGRSQPGAAREGRMPGAAGPWWAGGAFRARPRRSLIPGHRRSEVSDAQAPLKPSAMTNPPLARNPCSQSQGCSRFRGGHDLLSAAPSSAGPGRQ